MWGLGGLEAPLKIAMGTWEIITKPALNFLCRYIRYSESKRYTVLFCLITLVVLFSFLLRMV